CAAEKLSYLFPDAPAKLDNPDKGLLTLEREQVPCGITSPLVIRNKIETWKWWRVSCASYEPYYLITKLEASTNNDKTRRVTVYQDYNY
ncbi:hypothetical protein LY76DRAFT_518374, partial [Colletotrichum caudatum]